MTKTLDFYFDFGSPTAYLAYKRLGQLQGQYDLTINPMPVLLGGVFKATGNLSPVTIPLKGKYMLEYDLPRFAERYRVPLVFNPHFPINTLPLMRGAIAARQLDCLDSYMEAMFTAMWQQEANLGDPSVLGACLEAADLPAEALLALTQDAEVKAALIANTEVAVERGVFGAPTFFMEGEMYFGQDRLDFIEAALA